MLRYLDYDSNTTDSNQAAKLYFVLHASGSPIEVSYRPEGSTTTKFYYYVQNLQGDVVQVADSWGRAHATYTYNAWGKLLSAQAGAYSGAQKITDLNPLRYRGYVYDTDTQLYYLQSRYYDPNLGRFLNADVFTSTGQGLIGNNMFAYCINNPVNLADNEGNSAYDILNPNPMCRFDSIDGASGGGGIIIIYPIEIIVDVLGAISTIADEWEKWLDEQAKAIEAKMSQSLARYKSKKSNNGLHKHHIVPQNDTRGYPSYIILQEVYPDLVVDDPRNLIYVSARIHVPLHSNLYYFFVNNYITIAYLSAGDDPLLKEANVTDALTQIKIFISGLENL